jgi:hypothetical protein
MAVITEALINAFAPLNGVALGHAGRVGTSGKWHLRQPQRWNCRWRGRGRRWRATEPDEDQNAWQQNPDNQPDNQ